MDINQIEGEGEGESESESEGHNECRAMVSVRLVRMFQAFQLLRDQVEAAKRELSMETWALLNFTTADYTFVMNITRPQFEAICTSLFSRLLKPIEGVFRKSGLGAADIDNVVLVGGSTRIPFVRQRIKEFFDGRLEPYLKVPPEQAVAIGAGIQAGIVGHYWPLPTAAIENWDMIKAMRHKLGARPDAAGDVDDAEGDEETEGPEL